MPETNMTITEFLEARIAEDEAIARAAFDEPFLSNVDDGKWMANTSSASPNVEGRAYFSIFSNDDGPVAFLTSGQATHIARHNPARVLAECAAKRAIIEEHPLHRYPTTKRWDAFVFECGTCERCPCDTLKALAAVHKDHPDYLPEWAL